jgi:hypothetical protein
MGILSKRKNQPHNTPYAKMAGVLSGRRPAKMGPNFSVLSSF